MMGLQYLAGEGGIALLDVNPGLVIWTTVTFFLVMIVLWRFAWKPITTALDARADRIKSDLDKAESLRKEVESRIAEYESKLNGLREEGKELIAESRRDGERLKEEILSQAKKEADENRARGQKEVELAVDTALKKLHEDVATLSIAIAGQILGKSLKAEDHKSLIQDSISRIKTAAKN